MALQSTSKLTRVARYFIHLANKQKSAITNKKLQKLVYYAQAWSLVLRNKRLFTDEVEAWVHGPAVRVLYGQYKKFGFSAIDEDVASESIESISAEEKKLLNDIWRVYGKFDAGYLELLTHSEKPWQIARAELESHQTSSNTITTESMKEFYSQRLREAQSAK